MQWLIICLFLLLLIIQIQSDDTFWILTEPSQQYENNNTKIEFLKTLF